MDRREQSTCERHCHFKMHRICPVPLTFQSIGGRQVIIDILLLFFSKQAGTAGGSGVVGSGAQEVRMSNRPLITVLMPVYNGADYVGSAVESILGQTLEDFEFIIVNDGSTDRTTSILRDCSDRTTESL